MGSRPDTTLRNLVTPPRSGITQGDLDNVEPITPTIHAYLNEHGIDPTHPTASLTLRAAHLADTAPANAGYLQALHRATKDLLAHADRHSTQETHDPIDDLIAFIQAGPIPPNNA